MTNDTKIAIVGGGIAGLYCLYQLARLNEQSSTRNTRKYAVTLFESAENVGGRISTHRIYKDGTEEESNTPRIQKLEDLEFYLEYGPMRLELDQQILLKQLLDKFGIIEIKENDQELCIQKDKPFLVTFAEYTSPSTAREGVYQTYGAEREQEQGLDLLRLALVRIFLAINTADNMPEGNSDQERSFCFKVRQLMDKLEPSPKKYGEKFGWKELKFGWKELIMKTSFSVEHAGWKAQLQRWISQLTEGDYQNFREFAKLDGVFLYEMGFWNLLSDLMSHNAVSTLSELGTFYHLIPENPNAIE
jgi:NAD(P)-binding Rossmann-like domain